MDGLSAAASGIAVASLAIQLVDSVREIRRFFRTLKDAPEELDRLLDLLEHMELMLDNIEKMVEPESEISPSVLKAIQTCEKALDKLGALIQKVKRNSSAQSPLKRSLGFFKLACKKEEVEEIERQLDRAVSNLNMVMTALNLHGIQWLRKGVLATNAAAATITEVVLRMEVTANQKDSKQQLTVDNYIQKSSSALRRRTISHKVVYKGFLGSITARVQSESKDFVTREHSKDPYARDEWSWLFIPSFLSRCVEVKRASFPGSVERTLRTCPVLPNDHQVWSMCGKGELASIQELFRTREISPYAIDTHGRTLLHVATWYTQTETCSLLLNMGLRIDVVDSRGNPPEARISYLGTRYDQIESTYRLFAAANDDRNFANFCPMYFSNLKHLSVESFRSRVEKWVTEENVNLFEPSPLQVVTRRLCNLSIDPIECHKLQDIASHLIAKGAQFHDPLCLLEVAIQSVAHPIDSQTVGTRLLDMLAASNVDVAEYLAFEHQYHDEGLVYPKRFSPLYPSICDRRGVKLYIKEEPPFSISWDWWVDPEEEAFIVLHEFRHVGQAEYNDLYWLIPAERTLYWPFIYPEWTWYLRIGTWWKDEALLKRIEERYDRRWEKKRIKQAKIQGTYRKPKMPGAWIH